MRAGRRAAKGGSRISFPSSRGDIFDELLLRILRRIIRIIFIGGHRKWVSRRCYGFWYRWRRVSGNEKAFDSSIIL